MIAKGSQIRQKVDRLEDRCFPLGVGSVDEMDAVITGNRDFLEVPDIADLESFQFQRGLDSHRHDHVTVILVACRLDETGLGLVFEVELNFLIVHHFETIEHVFGIEADFE